MAAEAWMEPTPMTARQSGASAGQSIGQVPEVVSVLRERVGQRLTARHVDQLGINTSSPINTGGSSIGTAAAPFETTVEAVERVVQEVLDEHARVAVQMGVDPLDAADEAEVRRQLVASFAGLGGLQPLLEDPNVETININGCDRVFVQRRDGTRVRVDPIANSDEDLIALLRSLASLGSLQSMRPSQLPGPSSLAPRRGSLAGLVSGHERRFDHGNPELSLPLPGGARLHALMDVSDRVSVSIRCHPPVNIGLGDLVRAGEMDDVLAQLLAAMVRARLNIVVSGGPGTGKTTLLRGLSSAIPPAQRLIVIEDVSELRLPGEDHPDMVALQVREANLEGRGEIDSGQLVRSSLRMSPDRVIVGEVRGPEVVQMAKAMSIGIDGSMATVHASSSQKALMRLVAYAMEPGAGYTWPAATALIAGAVHIVVHLERLPDGQRVVASVREVLEETGDGSSGAGVGIASNEIFRPGPHGWAIPATPPRCLDLLARNGFDPAWLQVDPVADLRHALHHPSALAWW